MVTDLKKIVKHNDQHSITIFEWKIFTPWKYATAFASELDKALASFRSTRKAKAQSLATKIDVMTGKTMPSNIRQSTFAYYYLTNTDQYTDRKFIIGSYFNINTSTSSLPSPIFNYP